VLNLNNEDSKKKSCIVPVKPIMVKKKLIDIFHEIKLKDSRKRKHDVGYLFLLFLFAFNS